MQDHNNSYNNADSFAMAFDEAWRQATLEGILKDLGIEEYTPGKLPKKKVNRVDFSASTSE